MMTTKMIGLIAGASMTLIGFAWLIYLMIQHRRAIRLRREQTLPELGDVHELSEDDAFIEDEIVRVIKPDPALAELGFEGARTVQAPKSTPITTPKKRSAPTQDILAIHVLAKAEQEFAGYELLQAVAGAGLCFGEMQIFHRYQYPNGHGEILFSVASATEPGIFDMQKLGALRCAGLCLFMKTNGVPEDSDNFELMLATAMQLAEDLEGVLLDEQRKPLTDATIAQYRQRVFKQYSQHTMA